MPRLCRKETTRRQVAGEETAPTPAPVVVTPANKLQQ
jgi:hypothetical protein